MNKTNKQIVEEIKGLLAQLDFSEQSLSSSVTDDTQNFDGCMGGLQLLLSEGYFSEPRSRQEVIDKLVEKGRYYTPQLVSVNLKSLYKQKTLVQIGKKGSYKFVIRK